MDPILAVLAGVLVIVSMGLNSSLALRIGTLRASAVNYAVGLAGAGGLALVLGFGSGTGPDPSPWWAWTGGLLGVGVVAASNLVLPRIPVAAASILIVLGQMAMGLVLDALREGRVDPWQVGGGALVLAGVLIGRLGRKDGA